ncbi:MAG TPA: histidinol-phosphate transaminase [Porphyromonadaceae bacterium]|nr:histidinol-phosphate transaminase [Porphyromonadaceae bacterium]
MRTVDIEKMVRPNILALKPYSSARDEFSGNEGIFLDANENPYGTLNRYPDPHQKALKMKLSEVKNVPFNQIFIGNGSDEVIDLIYRIFCEPGKDSAIVCPPTYGMYEVSANINHIQLHEIPLTSDFQLDIEKILQTAETDSSVKLIFVCSPNNPTGNRLDNLEKLLENFNGIVVADEAYVDFCPEYSLKSKINKYPHLIVMQTFSKAWALAGVRVGMAFADEKIISLLDKTKPPYNVSIINQQVALEALSCVDEFEKRRDTILQQRAYLAEELSKLEIVKKIYPSDANFLLVEVSDANWIYNELVQKKVIVRNRTKQVTNCVRITIGTPGENEELLNKLRTLV